MKQPKLKRTTVFFSAFQLEKLNKITSTKGIHFSELVRRAVDFLIEKEGV